MTEIQMTKTIKTKAYTERPVVSKVEPVRGNGESGTKADLFEGDFLKCGFIAKAFEAVKNFNAGKFAFRIEIGSNSLIKLLGCYCRIFKTYIKGIHFAVIGNMHVGSLLKIINIDRYYHNFRLFFGKNRVNLFSFIMLVVPGAAKSKVLAALGPVELRGNPPGCFNTLDNFFLSNASMQKTSFSMLAEPDRFIRKRVIHKSKYISMVGESQPEKLGIQKTPHQITAAAYPSITPSTSLRASTNSGQVSCGAGRGQKTEDRRQMAEENTKF